MSITIKHPSQKTIDLMEELIVLIKKDDFNHKNLNPKIQKILKNPEFDINCFNFSKDLPYALEFILDEQKFNFFITNGFNLKAQFKISDLFSGEKFVSNLLVKFMSHTNTDLANNHSTYKTTMKTPAEQDWISAGFWWLLKKHPLWALDKISYTNTHGQKINTEVFNVLPFYFKNNDTDTFRFLNLIKSTPILKEYLKNNPLAQEKLVLHMLKEYKMESPPEKQSFDVNKKETRFQKNIDQLNTILEKSVHLTLNTNLMRKLDTFSFAQKETPFNYLVDVCALLFKYNICSKISSKEKKNIQNIFLNKFESLFLPSHTFANVENKLIFGLQILNGIKKMPTLFPDDILNQQFYKSLSEIYQQKISSSEEPNKLLNNTLFDNLSYRKNNKQTNTNFNYQKIQRDWENIILSINQFFDEQITTNPTITPTQKKKFIL